MITDIYLKDITDITYDNKQIETYNEIESLISQIKMILQTKQGDVIGDYNFGCNIEEYLFTFNLNEDELKYKIMNQIQTYCPISANYNINIDVKFFQGTLRDICIIAIYIENEKMFGLLIK